MKYWLYWRQQTIARIFTICVFQEHGNYCSSRHIFFRNRDNGLQISVTLRLGMPAEWNKFALSRLFIHIPAIALVFWWLEERDKREGENRDRVYPPSPPPPFIVLGENLKFVLHLFPIVCMWESHCSLGVILPVFREHSKWKIILPKLSLLTCIPARSVVFSFSVLKSIDNVCVLPQND